MLGTLRVQLHQQSPSIMYRYVQYNTTAVFKIAFLTLDISQLSIGETLPRCWGCPCVILLVVLAICQQRSMCQERSCSAWLGHSGYEFCNTSWKSLEIFGISSLEISGIFFWGNMLVSGTALLMRCLCDQIKSTIWISATYMTLFALVICQRDSASMSTHVNAVRTRRHILMLCAS